MQEEKPWWLPELVDRYQATAEALEECGRMLARSALLGDYAL
jgi:hypothetical protein